MELIVDASVLFAAIIGKGKTYDLFFEDRLKLVATSYLIEEFDKNTKVISDICGTSESEVVEVFDILKERIEILPIVNFSEEIQSQAEKLSPHSKDSPYFALALLLGSSIWTREKGFAKQDEIRIYFTSELVDMFLVE